MKEVITNPAPVPTAFFSSCSSWLHPPHPLPPNLCLALASSSAFLPLSALHLPLVQRMLLHALLVVPR